MTLTETRRPAHLDTSTMRATVFHGPNDIRVEEVPRPHAGPGEAVIRVTTTTICGTDIHILKGEYPVRSGLVVGPEPVGVIAELGAGVTGYSIGDRVLIGAITPCGQCLACLSGHLSQCGHGGAYEALGGWRFGNTINGAWAEYLLVPDARANLAPIPDGISDEQVVLVPDIFSTGLSGAESGNVRVGDSVAVFAQGPIGLCATLGAKLRGAALIIAIDSVPARLEMARRFGANVVINYREQDPVAAIKKLTEGRGADGVIDAVGMEAHGSPVAKLAQQVTGLLPDALAKPMMQKAGLDRLGALYSAIDIVRRGGTISIIGVYGGMADPLPMLTLFDKQIQLRMGQANVKKWVDEIMPLLSDDDPLGVDSFATHTMPLDAAPQAYDIFQKKQDGAVKVILKP